MPELSWAKMQQPDRKVTTNIYFKSPLFMLKNPPLGLKFKLSYL
jgi:hypothetical protein